MNLLRQSPLTLSIVIIKYNYLMSDYTIVVQSSYWLCSTELRLSRNEEKLSVESPSRQEVTIPKIEKSTR